MNNPLYRERVEEQTWWTLLDIASKYWKTKTYLDNVPQYNPVPSGNLWSGVNFISANYSFTPNVC